MKEFNVLIVDDEIHSIRGVQAGVKWESLNVSEVFTASSLLKAQEVFGQQKIDLLLCDIEMPKGSGLDLLKWVREYHPSTEAIFLTCHSDFSYAKRAIQLRSFNYLLKPVDYQELEEEIQKALVKIKKDHNEKKLRESYFDLDKSQRTVMLEGFWLDLINQTIPSSINTIKQHMKKFNISYTDKTTFLPILVHMQRWKQEFSIQDKKLLEYALQNAVREEIIGKNVNPLIPVVSLKADQVVILLPRDGLINVESLVEKCNQLIANFSEYFSCELCCYIGMQVQIDLVVDMVNKLQEFDRNNVTITNQTLKYRNDSKGESFVPPIPTEAWIELLKMGAFEKFLEVINEYFDNWKQDNTKITAQSLYLFYQDFLQIIFYVLQVKGIQANEVFSQRVLIETPEKVLQSLTSLQDWVLYIIDITATRILPPQGKGSVVEMVKQYIQNNIGELRLSRQDIANYVYLNPDYLTRLFKKETGLAISDYLQQSRLEYAKKLLVETNLPVSEVSLRAGYSNFSYFSAIFKKTTNLSPVEFRKEVSQ